MAKFKSWLITFDVLKLAFKRQKRQIIKCWLITFDVLKYESVTISDTRPKVD